MTTAAELPPPETRLPSAVFHPSRIAFPFGRGRTLKARWKTSRHPPVTISCPPSSHCRRGDPPPFRRLPSTQNRSSSTFLRYLTVQFVCFFWKRESNQKAKILRV
ncbi:hypothetical protein V8G54_030029 [Vigna mungo]|uniref:Uncharacterized protein n=1 Tax=Vigna mungo TaxID=3915 RepID=A0AAQ3RJQ5_VIGMU